MASRLPKPRARKNVDNTQLSYELPHRIHTAKVYPILSPNGSTIIICGTETGARVMWRGGRPFKTTAAASSSEQKTNGGTNAVISLDSDDEMSAPKFEDKPEFEDEEEQWDPSHPYPEILQTLDLHFGTDVLRLATLRSSILKAEGSSWQNLRPLQSKIVFAVACADNSVKLVTIPTTPPSPASKARPEFRNGNFADSFPGKGTWGETVTSLFGLHKPSEGLSLTLNLNIADSSKTEPQFIVASHTHEVSGVLYMYRISTKSPEAGLEPFQKIFLSSPAKSISFNPSLDSQRSSHLLVADMKGACRIYDYSKLALTSTLEEGTEGLAAQQGTWLLSLYTRFQNTKTEGLQPYGTHSGYGRNRIVDAQWVLAGKAVIVLLADGEWGIWDIEGAGPSASRGLLGPQGVKSGSVSEFNLTGYLDTAVKSRQAGPPQIAPKKTFAPMTPSTRKTVDLFSSRSPTPANHGQISVIDIPSSSSTNSSKESVVFWLGDTFTQISNLSQYWSANSRKGSSKASGSLFSGATTSRTSRIEGINLRGERCLGIEQITTSYSADPPTDLLVLGEHRFAFLASGKPTREPKRAVTEKLALVQQTQSQNRDLSVMDIDSQLDRLESNRSRNTGKLFQV